MVVSCPCDKEAGHETRSMASSWDEKAFEARFKVSY